MFKLILGNFRAKETVEILIEIFIFPLKRI